MKGTFQIAHFGEERPFSHRENATRRCASDCSLGTSPEASQSVENDAWCSVSSRKGGKIHLSGSDHNASTNATAWSVVNTALAMYRKLMMAAR